MKKALVIVDMQNDFVTGCLGTKEAAGIVGRVAEYAKKFEEGSEGDIIFTRDTHGGNYMDTQEGKNLPVPHCIRWTEGWEIVPQLKEAVNMVMATVFDKGTFGSTELACHISANGYDEVIFCGVCTGICVISNVLMAKAFAPETKLTVLADLCACVTEESHRTALDAMRTCQVNVI